MRTEALELLDKPLEASRVKTREAGGNRPKLAYLETHDVIRTANLIFGFGQWGHEVIELRPIPGVSFTSNGKTGLHLGYVCIVRLTVEGCVPTSGIGYGDATEYRDVAPVTAHELAAKEAESDALKRALKNYGDQFGLALYSKDAASAGHIASNGSSSSDAPGRQGAPDNSLGNGAPAFPHPAGQLRSDAQGKLLHVLYKKLSEAEAITEEAFCNSARQGGAQGTTAQACCESITKTGASELISKLKKLETNVQAAA